MATRRRHYWSRYYPFCQDCKTRDWPHKARGYCSSCYGKRYDRGEFDGTVPWSWAIESQGEIEQSFLESQAASAYEAFELYEWLSWHLWEHFPRVQPPKPRVGSRPVRIDEHMTLRDSPDSPLPDVEVFDELLHWMCGEASRLGLDAIYMRLEGVDDELDDHIRLLRQEAA